MKGNGKLWKDFEHESDLRDLRVFNKMLISKTVGLSVNDKWRWCE